MDELWIAVGKIGGFAALGALIDLAMRKGERKHLKDWLIVWWDRFDSVNWHNFCRKEAQLAIQILDSSVGRHFWSWKRLVIVLAVGALASMAATTLSTYSIARALPPNSPAAPSWTHVLEQTISGTAQLAWFTGVLCTFALSMSVNRAISSVAASVASRPSRSILVFSALLLLHVLLFIFWTSIVLHVVNLFVLAFANYLFGSLDAKHIYPALLEGVVPWWKSFTWESHFRGLFVLIPGDLQKLWEATSKGMADSLQMIKLWESVARAVTESTFERILGFLAYGMRIAFTLVFLSSYVFRPLIQEPVSRLWAGMIDADKPVFTTLLTIVGVVLALLGLGPSHNAG